MRAVLYSGQTAIDNPNAGVVLNKPFPVLVKLPKDPVRRELEMLSLFRKYVNSQPSTYPIFIDQDDDVEYGDCYVYADGLYLYATYVRKK